MLEICLYLKIVTKMLSINFKSNILLKFIRYFNRPAKIEKLHKPAAINTHHALISSSLFISYQEAQKKIYKEKALSI